MIFYHVCKKPFEWPDIDAIEDFIVKNKKHPNGTLGLWISTSPKSCRGFGEEVGEIKIKDDAIHVKMTIRQLYAYSSGGMDLSFANENENFDIEAHDRLVMNLHKEMGREMARFADVLYIVDANHCAGEVVVLDFDAIEKIKWHDQFDFERRDIEQYAISSIPFDEEAQQKINNIYLSDGKLINGNTGGRLRLR